MRRTWVYIDGIAYEKGTEPVSDAHHVMTDFKAPYKSMIDGTMIESRAQHREHLKRNGCREVGNEVKAHLSHYDRVREEVQAKQRESARELIRAQVNEMDHRQFRQALKRDADRVKWNSNY